MVTAALRTTPLDRLRARIDDLVRDEGHTSLTDPDLCLYRFSQPTTYTKGASYGVTLGIVVQGAKRVRIGERELVIDPHRLFVITRESEHLSAVIEASPSEPYLGVALCFSPERVARALIALAEANVATPEAAPRDDRAFVTAIDLGVVDALDRLLRCLADPVERKLIAPLVLDEILYRLLRSDAAAAVRRGAAAAADAPRILASMQYIRANLARKLTVDGLARASAMSPSHFAHRFRAIARVAPMRYLREVRLERARALLFETGARAGDVAAQCGFESAAHFTREFKRRYGAPPSRYVSASR